MYSKITEHLLSTILKYVIHFLTQFLLASSICNWNIKSLLFEFANILKRFLNSYISHSTKTDRFESISPTRCNRYDICVENLHYLYNAKHLVKCLMNTFYSTSISTWILMSRELIWLHTSIKALSVEKIFL